MFNMIVIIGYLILPPCECRKIRRRGSSVIIWGNDLIWMISIGSSPCAKQVRSRSDMVKVALWFVHVCNISIPQVPLSCLCQRISGVPKAIHLLLSHSPGGPLFVHTKNGHGVVATLVWIFLKTWSPDTVLCELNFKNFAVLCRLVGHMTLFHMKKIIPAPPALRCR